VNTLLRLKQFSHCVTTVQLSQEEASDYRRCPVVLDFKSGFYVFPVSSGDQVDFTLTYMPDDQPNEDNVVKLAIHSAGYTHFEGKRSTSTPRTVTSDPESGLLIPRAALADLRGHLRNIYPELAEKPFRSTRLCW
jgi:sarcosine oxidase/L-pipecolate oxidase